MFKVPHPNILIATNEFRSTQDKINIFIMKRCVICKTKTQLKTKQYLADAAELYVAWHISNVDKNADGPKIRQGLERILASSAVSSFVKEDALKSQYFYGCRFLKAGELPASNEIYYHSQNEIFISDDNEDNPNLKLSKDSNNPSEPIKKEKVDKNNDSASSDSDSDSDIDIDSDEIKKNESKLKEELISKHKEDNAYMKNDILKAQNDVKNVKCENSEQYYNRLLNEWKNINTQPKTNEENEENELLAVEEKIIAATRYAEHEHYRRQISERQGIAMSYYANTPDREHINMRYADDIDTQPTELDINFMMDGLL
jgi:hypothetical protein